jgi:hypothetical protein
MRRGTEAWEVALEGEDQWQRPFPMALPLSCTALPRLQSGPKAQGQDEFRYLLLLELKTTVLFLLVLLLTT